MALPDPPHDPSAAAPADTTINLLERVRAGDPHALDILFERCLPTLRRWARGRLPAYARDLADTQDLVQETALRALQRLPRFESRHQGALQAYLRQAVQNRIRDEIRRVRRRPIGVEIDERVADDSPSPVEHAIGREGVERYEAALQRLKPGDRQAIIARFELQQSYEEMAVALGKPSPDAARVGLIRAIQRLIGEMDREG